MSAYNVMCFKVPWAWTDATLREAVEVVGPTLSVELFRPKEGEQGFGTAQHKGYGKLVFQDRSSVEALLSRCVTKRTQKHGEQLHCELSGATLVLKREHLDDRAAASEQARHRVEAGMSTKKILVECVGASELQLGVNHEFRIKIKNNSIRRIDVPHAQRASLDSENALPTAAPRLCRVSGPPCNDGVPLSQSCRSSVSFA